MTNDMVAQAERHELNNYTARNAAFLVQDEVLAGCRESDHKEKYIYWTIGQLAHNLCQVGEVDAAVELTENLLTDIDADDTAVLQTWSSLADYGSNAADGRLRIAMGLTYDRDGNTVLPDDFDFLDSRNFYRLLSLYKFGDNSVAPRLHDFVSGLEGESIKAGAYLAEKVYSAGDDSAYDLVKSAAHRAREYAFAQVPDTEELDPGDAANSAIKKSIANALSPTRSELERLYNQTDSCLRYFAVKLLETNDLERADEIQGLMLSAFHTAWVNAKRVELGYDPDGSRARAAKEYIAIFGEDVGDHIQEITGALVRGGDAEVTSLYEHIYDPTVLPENVDLGKAADMLVALHHAGDTRAHDRLIELSRGSEDAWRLIYGLDKMGFQKEAVEIARQEFARNPNHSTALTLLNVSYDSEAMAIVQAGCSQFDHSLIDVVFSWARYLRILAAHINDLEKTA